MEFRRCFSKVKTLVIRLYYIIHVPILLSNENISKVPRTILSIGKRFNSTKKEFCKKTVSCCAEFHLYHKKNHYNKRKTKNNSYNSKWFFKDDKLNEMDNRFKITNTIIKSLSKNMRFLN